MRKIGLVLWLLCLMSAPVLAQEATEEAVTVGDFVFGMVLVGPKNDGGWSQAHYEGGLMVEDELDASMVLFESFAITDTPMRDVVEEMANQGARLIFMTSADFAPLTNEIALEYPDIVFIQVAGDAVLTATAPANVGNLMGQGEYAKFMMGCAAALVTETGEIGYLGPLIDGETRRLASSAYLGARHCWEEYRHRSAASLRFRIEWVGYWYYIPDQTRNPRRLVFSMYNDNIDVVIAGIDTPTPLEVALDFHEDGREVYATAYDSVIPCEESPEVCIGAAFYNWGIPYQATMEAVIAGEWRQSWEWVGPEWDHFSEPGLTPVGFVRGGAFPLGRLGDLEDFATDMEEYALNQFVPTSFPLWQGVLRYQDGSLLAEEDELVNLLDIWYLPQLLEGMEGESFQFELGLGET